MAAKKYETTTVERSSWFVCAQHCALVDFRLSEKKIKVRGRARNDKVEKCVWRKKLWKKHWRRGKMKNEKLFKLHFRRWHVIFFIFPKKLLLSEERSENKMKSILKSRRIMCFSRPWITMGGGLWIYERKKSCQSTINQSKCVELIPTTSFLGGWWKIVKYRRNIRRYIFHERLSLLALHNLHDG